VDLLAKQAAELALRLATLQLDGSRNDVPALEELEQLAVRVLNQITAMRASRQRPAGETCGMWRVIQPVQRS